jgi:hypothetical protein
MQTKEQFLIDQVKNLSIGRNAGLRQVVQRPQNEIAPRKIPQGELPATTQGHNVRG